MNKEDILRDYLGQLKYQKSKMLIFIELINSYIYRIEENTAKVKCSDTAMEEEYKNKDLKREVEELLKELKDSDD